MQMIEAGGHAFTNIKGVRRCRRRSIRNGIFSVVFTLCLGSQVAAQADFKSLAKRELENKEYQAALSIITDAHNSGSADIESYRLLAEVYLNLGNGIPAEAAIDRARQLGADYAAIAVPYAKALLVQGKFSDALSALRGIRIAEEERLSSLIITGDAYFAVNDFEAAKRNYETAVSEFPEDFQAYLGLARLALRDQNLEEANRLADTAHEREQSNTMVEYTRGLLARYMNDIPKAEDRFLDAVRLFPGNLMANLELTGIRINQGRLDEAEQYLDRVYEAAPKNQMAQYMSAVILASRGDYDQADALLKRARNLTFNYLPAMYVQGLVAYQLEDLETSLEFLSRVLRVRPNNKQARLALAGTYLKLQQPTNAFRTIDPLLRAEPNDPNTIAMSAAILMASGDVERGKALYEQLSAMPSENEAPALDGLEGKLAMAQFVAGDTEKALATLSAVTSGRESQIRELGVLGSMQLRTKDYDGAELTIGKILRTDPDRALGYNMRGSLEFARRQFQRAVVSFSQAIDRDPLYYTAIRNRGLAYMNLGSYNEAENDLKDLLADQPNDVRAKAALGKALLENDKAEEAVPYFREAVRSIPNSVDLWADYSQALGDAGNTTRAIEEARRTAVRGEDRPDILRRMGLLLLELGQPRAASRPLSRYAAFLPNDGEAQLLNARALLQNGLYTGAGLAFRRALGASTNPADTDVVDWYLFSSFALAQKFNEAEEMMVGLKTEKRPDDVAPSLIGQVYLSQGELPAAISAFRTAMRLNQTEALSIGLANALEAQGNQEESVQVLTEHLEREPGARLVRLDLARRYENLEDLNNAGRQYEALLQSGVADADVVARLALVYKDLGNRTSVKLAERAYLMAPDDPFVLYVSGVVTMQAANKPLEAGEFLERAVRRDPGNALYKYELGRVYFAKGNRVDARKFLRQALSLDPDFKGALDARRILLDIE